MTAERTIFDEPHHQSLEFLAAQALADGEVASAFKFADRRCRILPTPEPHCYVLRAEAYFKMGAVAAAVTDIARAIALAPDNVPANRRMLAWGQGPEKMRAASALLAREQQFEALRKAVKTVREYDRRNLANVTVFEQAIEGWALWNKHPLLEISIAGGAEEVTTILEPDAFHPLADFGHAVSFRIDRPRPVTAQSIQLSTAGSPFYSVRAPAIADGPRPWVHRPRVPNSRSESVTVIVPVFADYSATRLCLESLLDDLRSGCHRAILVDDATPEPQIAEYLAKTATKPNIKILTNPRNVGFIASVNLALAEVNQGDVILLNSDTVVPRGFIDRLAAAARLFPDIGTVTPLSNNGEFTSFPLPNQINPLPPRREIDRIDAAAAKLNEGRIIDIPSGIGFCLYVTRACLDLIGPLAEDFGSGYLEDADFCLRARERGLRNVCAPSVYVGHAGSKSFGQEKRSLVVRNLDVLERRFPNHRAECAAFMAADPLRTARAAVECAAKPARPRLLVTGAGAISAVARDRARKIAEMDGSAMILEIHHSARVKIFDASGGLPQSLRFDLSSPTECRALLDFAKTVRPSRLEILDPTNVPFALVDLLRDLKVPYDIFIADGSLLGAHEGWHCALQSIPNKAATGDPSAVRGEPPGTAKEWLARWRKIAESAERIFVPSSEAAALAADFLPKRKIELVERSARKRRQIGRKPRKANPHLGFVPVRACTHEQFLIGEITRRLRPKRPESKFTVIGKTFDDINLMRCSGAFVTGTVTAEEFDNLVDALNLGYLLIGITRPLFGHPILAAARSCLLPIAYFDWTAGRIKARKKDLPLDPSSSLDDITASLSRWMGRR
jgi:GT2 family glycosyltransferase